MTFNNSVKCTVKASLKYDKDSFKCAQENYQKPELLCFGDVRDLTLGGSPGGGDSGTPTTRRRR